MAGTKAGTGPERIKVPIARTEPQAGQVLAHLLDDEEATTVLHFSSLTGRQFNRITEIKVEDVHAAGRSDITITFGDDNECPVTVVLELKLGAILGEDQEEREARADFLVTVTLDPLRTSARDADLSIRRTTWDELLAPYQGNPLAVRLGQAVARIAHQPRVAARLSVVEALHRAEAKLQERGITHSRIAATARGNTASLWFLDGDGHECADADVDSDAVYPYAEIEATADGAFRSTVMLAVSGLAPDSVGFLPALLHKDVWSDQNVADALRNAKAEANTSGTRRASGANPDPERQRLAREGADLKTLLGYDMRRFGWAGYGRRLTAHPGRAEIADLIDDTLEVMCALRDSLRVHRHAAASRLG